MARTKEPRKRPLEHKPATEDIICERIADGQSVREICRDDNMPAMSTISKWHLSEYACSQGWGGQSLRRNMYSSASAASSPFETITL
jgi:hypothetical protein